MATKYPYTIEPQTDGTFFVQFLDFPNGFTEGRSVENAKVMAKEMITLLAESITAQGVALPTASAVGKLDFVEI